MLSGWTYRKSHTLTHSIGGLTDYQIKIRVYRTTGTDTGNAIYVGDKCNPDFGDIRFTNSSDTELSYWIENYNSQYADIWVKVDSIGTSTNIYVYYGNPSATTTSNDDTTFVFFDDFAGDLSKWTSAGTPTISSGILTLNTTSGTPNEGIASISTFGTNYAIRARVNIPSALYGGVGFDTSIGGAPMVDVQYQTNGSNNVWLRNNNGTNTYSAALGNSGAYHIWDIKRNGSTNTSVSIDDATPVVNSGSVPTGNLNCALWIYYSGSNPTLLADWVLVRQYTATEPTHTSWGTEEWVFGDYDLLVILSKSSGYTPLTVNVNVYIKEELSDFKLIFGDGDSYNASSKHHLAQLIHIILREYTLCMLKDIHLPHLECLMKFHMVLQSTQIQYLLTLPPPHSIICFFYRQLLQVT